MDLRPGENIVGGSVIKAQIEQPEPVSLSYFAIVLCLRHTACTWSHCLFSFLSSDDEFSSETGSTNFSKQPQQLSLSSVQAHDTQLSSPFDDDSSGAPLSDADDTSTHVPKTSRSLSCPPPSTVQSQLMFSSSGHLQLQKTGQVDHCYIKCTECLASDDNFVS